MRQHLLEGHGPLAARYPTAPAGGKTRIKEGDSPTFLYLLAPGLSDHEQPEWGGWGGRRERFAPDRNFFIDGRDRHPPSQDPVRESYWTLARWSGAISRDFAARLDWCVKDGAAANHAPIAHLEGDVARRVLQRTVTAGQTVVLDAAGSHDPDNDALTYRWWQNIEPGSLRGDVALAHPDTAQVSFIAPDVVEPRTLHIILEVEDSGSPPLTGYRRIVFTLPPRSAAGAEQEP